MSHETSGSTVNRETVALSPARTAVAALGAAIVAATWIYLVLVRPPTGILSVAPPKP